MFVDGCLKYLERTSSLYQASMDSFRESLQRDRDPGSVNYVDDVIDMHSGKSVFEVPEKISNLQYFVDVDYESKHGGSNNKEIDLVVIAHYLYKWFRHLIADTILTMRERLPSRKLFLAEQMTTSDAYKAIQIELNLIYDIFYTKVNMLRKAHGVSRLFSITAVIACLLIFSFKDKQKYHKVDVFITYVLLVGAHFMDVIGCIMILFSLWTVVAFRDSKGGSNKFVTNTLGWWLRHRPCRWSKKISQYNLLYQCLNDHPRVFKLLWTKQLKDVFTDMLYTCEKDFEDELWDLIFDMVRKKAKESVFEDEAMAVLSARGRDLVFIGKEYADYTNILAPWTIMAEYDECLLLWHIATDFCISRTSTSQISEDSYKFQKYSEKLSDYITYLLIRQPAMTSAVAGPVQVRFQDTCEAANDFIARKLQRNEQYGKIMKVKRFFLWLLGAVKNLLIMITSCSKKPNTDTDWKRSDVRFHPQVCKVFIQYDKYMSSGTIEKTDSSALFDACQLAKELEKLGDKQWEVTFKVWVELLCYAASRCNPTSHVQRLSQGGELITFVWLLMAHFGFGEVVKSRKDLNKSDSLLTSYS